MVGGASSGIASLVKLRRLNRFAAEVHSIDDAAIGACLIKPVIDTDAKAADIDIHSRWSILADDFLHPASDLHRVETLAGFDLG